MLAGVLILWYRRSCGK